MEEPLVGGAVSGPARVGDTVRRPRASEAVHRVLQRLERVGFVGVARLLSTVLFGPSLDETAPRSMRANADWVAQWTP